MIDYMLRLKDKKNEHAVFHYLERSQEITSIFDAMKDSRRKGPQSS